MMFWNGRVHGICLFINRQPPISNVFDLYQMKPSAQLIGSGGQLRTLPSRFKLKETLCKALKDAHFSGVNSPDRAQFARSVRWKAFSLKIPVRVAVIASSLARQI
jgi:hypothetical protein